MSAQDSPNAPQDEAERLAALEGYAVLGTPAEASFDGLAGLAAQICDAPLGLITFVGGARQFFKARVGFAGGAAAPLDAGFCPLVVRAAAPLVIPDAGADPAYADNPAVTRCGMRFYAGVPLRDPDSHVLGTICVLDRVPRPGGLPDRQLRALETLAAQTMAQLELRRTEALARREGARAARQGQRLALLAEASARLLTADTPARAVRDAYAALAGTFRLDACFHYRCEAGGLHLVASVGLNAAQEAQAARLEVGQAICGIVAATRRAVHLSGVLSSDDPQAAFLRALGIDAYLSTPLLAGDELLGTLSFGRRREAFSPGELEVLQTLASNIAITLERLRAEEGRQATEVALRESKARLHGAIEGLPFPVMLHAENGEVLALSRSWTSCSGYAPEEIPTRSAWFRLAYPDTYDHAVAEVARGFASPQVKRAGEFTIRAKSGEARIWDFQIVPLGRLPDGRPLQISAAVDVTERKRTEEALRQQLRLTEAITGNAAVSLFIMDERQHCVFMNPAAEKLTGFTLEEVKGRALHDMIHHTRPDGSHYPLEECPIDRAFPERARMQGEEVFVHRDGHFYRVAFTASPILEDGRPVGTVIEVQDITEAKASEAALRQGEALKGAVLEGALDCIITIDQQGRVTEWNPAAERTFGRAREQALGRDVAELIIPPEHRAAHRRGLARYLAAGHSSMLGRRVEVEALRADGTRFPAELAITPASVGNRTLFIAYLRDIAERQAAEAALRESEERLRAITANAAEALFLMDTENRITFMNPAAERMFGWPRGALLGRVLHDVLHHRHPDGQIFPAEDCPLRHVLASGRGLEGHEDIFFRRDGTPVPVECSNAPVLAEDGRVAGAVLAVHDITRRKEAEAVLARDKAELERLVEARTAALLRAAEERRRAEETARQAEKLAALGQLTGGVAHDFNNLLQVITSGAVLLKRPDLSGERRAAILESMIQASRRGGELTGRLLAFVRRQSLRPQSFDVNARLGGMSELLRQSLGSRIRIETDFAPDLWPAHADPGQFETAILNLAVNARDAMPDGGSLTLQTRNAVLTTAGERAAGEYVCIAVKDTGTGMPPHILSRVFEPFFTTKAADQGTGLGLPQVHGFARQSGGDLQVESEPGRGTVVLFHLPRAPAHIGDAGGPGLPDTRRPHALQGVGKVVLVVEDNPDVAAFACALLEDLGYATRRAGSAAEALERLAESEAVDVVFSDVVMPGRISGAELAATLRTSHPNLAVVLATGYSEQLAKGGTPEGIETLAKPYRPDELAAAVQRALARSGRVPEAAG